jgi:hypothetical protein
MIVIKSEDGNVPIVTDLFNALPGNSSVNMLQRATMETMSQYRML